MLTVIDGCEFKMTDQIIYIPKRVSKHCHCTENNLSGDLHWGYIMAVSSIQMSCFKFWPRDN